MRKNIFLWALYDFANSIIMIVFLFYFSQWLVVDSGKPDWWYNATLIGPITWSIILAATGESGSASYSYAIISMGILVLIGLLVIRKIKLV